MRRDGILCSVGCSVPLFYRISSCSRAFLFAVLNLNFYDTNCNVNGIAPNVVQLFITSILEVRTLKWKCEWELRVSVN